MKKLLLITALLIGLVSCGTDNTPMTTCDKLLQQRYYTNQELREGYGNMDGIEEELARIDTLIIKFCPCDAVKTDSL